MHLCKNRFFAQAAEMKLKRWLAVVFDEDGEAILGDEAYGRVTGATWGSDGKRS